MTESAARNDSPELRTHVPLHKASARISPEAISVRPSRAGLWVPVFQALMTVGAIWLIGAYIDRLNIWVLMGLLVFTLIFGPISALGIVYGVAGTSFLMERRKQSARWQQGIFGLGLGTKEFVAFDRIDHFAVIDDGSERLSGGQRQDLVQWTVQLVKDNGRVLDVASTVTARALVEDGAERANVLAEALAAMAGVPCEPGDPAPLVRGTRRFRRIDREG